MQLHPSLKVDAQTTPSWFPNPRSMLRTSLLYLQLPFTFTLFYLIFLCARHPGVIFLCSASSIATCHFVSMIEVPQRLTKSSSFVALLSTGCCHTLVVMCRSDLIIMLQLSVVTSCNQFCHHLISSSEFEVKELSRSHEILSSIVGFTRSWSCTIIW